MKVRGEGVYGVAMMIDHVTVMCSVDIKNRYLLCRYMYQIHMNLHKKGFKA